MTPLYFLFCIEGFTLVVDGGSWELFAKCPSSLVEIAIKMRHKCTKHAEIWTNKSTEKPFLNDLLKIRPPPPCGSPHKEGAECCSHSIFSIITREQCTIAKKSADKKDLTFYFLHKRSLYLFSARMHTKSANMPSQNCTHSHPNFAPKWVISSRDAVRQTASVTCVFLSFQYIIRALHCTVENGRHSGMQLPFAPVWRCLRVILWTRLKLKVFFCSN